MQIIKNTKKYTLALVGMIVLLSSCEKEYESIESIDEAKIKAYIQQNNIPALKDPSGFYYQVLEQGTGGPLLDKDSVFYNSTIKSLTGTTFYSPTEYASQSTYLGYVNPAAYRTAMLSINRGGKVRVIVPSYLAFGKNGQDNVPSNEVLVAEISVLPDRRQIELDDRMIREFLAAKGLTGFTKTPSRVYKNVSVLGTGAAITDNSTIKVKYKGRLLNGTQFDASPEPSMESIITNLIVGWQKVLLGVPNGTKMRIFIPSDLGYGRRADSGLPINSVLDFDIEIVDVVN